MTWSLAFRIINIIGCVISLWFLATAAFRQWRSWTNKTQAHWWALGGWVFVGLEGSIESIIQRSEPGPRIIIQTLVIAWTLRALSIKGDLQAHSEVPWKDRK